MAKITLHAYSVYYINCKVVCGTRDLLTIKHQPCNVKQYSRQNYLLEKSSSTTAKRLKQGIVIRISKS